MLLSPKNLFVNKIFFFFYFFFKTNFLLEKNSFFNFINFKFIKIKKKAQIFAVKAVLDQSDNFHLVDVGLRGVSKIELIDGYALFSALKFASTSYNNEVLKFFFVF